MLRSIGDGHSRIEAALIYPAVQNLLLAARSLGLAANVSTWHLMAEGEVKHVLGIPRSVHTYLPIPLGWPGRNHRTSAPMVRRANDPPRPRGERWLA